MKNTYTRISFGLYTLVGILLGCAHTSRLDLTSDEQAYLEKIKITPLEFNVSKEEINDAWARAQSFVSKYKMTYFEPKGDFLIESQRARPTGNEISYRVVKTPVADGFLITVETFGGLYVKKDAETNGQILAYYIKTGELPYPRLVKSR